METTGTGITETLIAGLEELERSQKRSALRTLRGRIRFDLDLEKLWAKAGDLGFWLRRRGVTPKTIDLLIATYALSHSAALLTVDKDFLAMRKAGVPLQLAAP